MNKDEAQMLAQSVRRSLSRIRNTAVYAEGFRAGQRSRWPWFGRRKNPYWQFAPDWDEGFCDGVEAKRLGVRL